MSERVGKYETVRRLICTDFAESGVTCAELVDVMGIRDNPLMVKRLSVALSTLKAGGLVRKTQRAPATGGGASGVGLLAGRHRARRRGWPSNTAREATVARDTRVTTETGHHAADGRARAGVARGRRRTACPRGAATLLPDLPAADERPRAATDGQQRHARLQRRRHRGGE